MMIAVVGSMFILSTIMVSSFSYSAYIHHSLTKFGIQIGVAWLAGARFDLALEQLKQGRLVRPDPFEAEKIVKQYDHEEL